MQRSTLSRTALVLMFSLVINASTMFCLVLGSGVMPIRMSELFLATVPVSFAVAFVSYFVRWRVKLLIAALMLTGFFATGRIFGYFLNNGFERAKSYASRLALEVKTLHEKTGTWPAELAEIPPERRPLVDAATMGPYRYYEEENLYLNVGGFYIIYEIDKQTPRLRVARRDISVSWNWQASQWEDTP